ncbi:hypothetical protein CGH76_23775 [Vibrio parahaemolyticus]|nr:hypothetical protein [Vibrio parahaemolyticus]EGR2932003.1 hypothetical protein [Vibrio parahaemolyticus]EGR2958409.1 hypothetical protein [Vibrio parahaemolyticus]EGR2962966.1 hypothetical protein [Vibrio parahaemolyticus]EGR2966533.1 hypothetical protein [Vibrio parahaemolyticus]
MAFFASTSVLVFMAQCFRFGWRRCSPLNWALYAGAAPTKSGLLSFFDCYLIHPCWTACILALSVTNTHPWE